MRHHSLGSGEVTCRHSQPSSKQTNLLHLVQEVAVASRAFSLLLGCKSATTDSTEPRDATGSSPTVLLPLADRY
jgi:hypothetical protein